MAEGKGPARLNSLIQIDETALLDNDQQAVRAGLSKGRGAGFYLFLTCTVFFGGPIKAEFGKATAMIQKTFLSDDPVIICSTTEQEYQARIAGVSAITENSQILRVEEPSQEETVEILRIAKPHFEAEYDITIEDKALKIAANLAQRYLTITPLPLSAEQLMHRTAAMVNMAKQAHLAFKPEVNDAQLDVEDVTLVESQMTGIPVSKLGEDERATLR